MLGTPVSTSPWLLPISFSPPLIMNLSTRYARVRSDLLAQPRIWLVTGVAGFIGSHLLETLLRCGQTVAGLDNFATGHRHNLDDVRQRVDPAQWARFSLIEGDIRDPKTCQAATTGVAHVLHQAALGSVPGSLEDPITSCAVNIGGFLNVLLAARDHGVVGFVYAASSAVYGDQSTLPHREERAGRALSPYALTKQVDELYAEVFQRSYGFDSIGLRYFNVFGPRQDPDGAYAAVIPRWAAAMLEDREVCIHGDGATSRDFCFVEDVVQANLLAACAPPTARNRVYNVALGQQTSLIALYAAMQTALAERGVFYHRPPVHQEVRTGDIRHSRGDIERAVVQLGFVPRHSLSTGMAQAMAWYTERHRQTPALQRTG